MGGGLELKEREARFSRVSQTHCLAHLSKGDTGQTDACFDVCMSICVYIYTDEHRIKGCGCCCWLVGWLVVFKNSATEPYRRRVSTMPSGKLKLYRL